MGMTVVLADTLHRALANLDGSARRRIVDFLIKLQTEPHSSGVRLKPIRNARDSRVRVARVTDDLRAVLVHVGAETYVVQTVLPHDAAYRHAEQLSCTVNAVTGAVEMLETVRIEQKVDAVVAEAPTTAVRLFAQVSDRDFDRLGIPAIVVPALRHVTDEATLLDLVEPLPALQQDILLSLVDRTPDEVYAAIVAPAADSGPVPADVADALRRPANQAAYLVVTDAAELADALAWPMDRWRTYLHPTQRSLAYPTKPYSGPVRVTGGPGTGKTVIAVHRAKALADAASPGERVLVTTFGATLARTLRDLLCRLAGEALLDRVDVLTTDQLARRLVEQSGATVRPLADDACLGALTAHLAQTGSELDATLVKDEWERVILDQGLTTEAEYLSAVRRGRFRPLATAQKKAVWAAVHSFTASLARQGTSTFPQITAAATGIVAAWTTPPYRHVVVDEAQDMTPVQWRLLRAVAPIAPDDLFLVGDAHQRIYARAAALSHQGIHTRGRSRRLTISYRTTREILRAGIALLRGHHYDDLDVGTDTLDGYRSLMHGPAPRVSGHSSSAAELVGLAKSVITWHDAGVPWEEIAVGVRTRGLASRTAEELAGQGIPVVVVSGDSVPPVGRAHVMTLHRLKGLEYRCVAVAGLREGAVPPASALNGAGDDQPARRAVLERERSLVFVACTRAREALAVSWHHAPSPIIAPLIVDARTRP
ncbi:MAG TPA: UvrD-helicase domain-containing protein [Pilimelia sp.]|nr:UvrD-helicase domain-containing protein [Pilimelia sp.]